MMLQKPRGEWDHLSAKLLNESKSKFDTYLSSSGDAVPASQAQGSGGLMAHDGIR